MKKVSLKTIISTLLIILILLLTDSLALAQDGANVYLEQVDSTNETLTVDVMVENVSDLYGAEFRLKYDPTVLVVQDLNPEQNGVQIETGTLLSADQGFVVANKVDEAMGQVVFAMTLLHPAPPVSGAGPLARVTFKVLQRTPSSLSVEHAKLVAADLQTIPSAMGSLSIGSEAQPQTATAVPVTADTSSATASESGFPWWIVAVLVMLLGVLALGGLIIMGSNKSNITPTTPKQTVRQPVGQQPERPSGSRPSAFKQQHID
ncbi:cohesin domain-containing protein [Chloroflexota bacterium]